MKEGKNIQVIGTGRRDGTGTGTARGARTGADREEGRGHTADRPGDANRRYAAAARRQRKRRVLAARIRVAGVLLMLCLAACFLLPWIDGWIRPIVNRGADGRSEQGSVFAQDAMESGELEKIQELLGTDALSGSNRKELQELAEMYERNEEARDFVKGYAERADYRDQPIDLTADMAEGGVPLLMQWDKRWGYDLYGDSMIGLAGCGPTCLSMACLYLTGNTEWNPRAVAQFAWKNGYYTEEGTSWALWTEGVESLGLYGEELPLDRSGMERALEGGSLIVCSMRPGDFTTTGHFILLCGYDENGFFVRDPNRRSNSEKQWTYDVLKGQIKNLWRLSTVG